MEPAQLCDWLTVLFMQHFPRYRHGPHLPVRRCAAHAQSAHVPNDAERTLTRSVQRPFLAVSYPVLGAVVGLGRLRLALTLSGSRQRL
jgi:hypothetical protein